ncbi:MAG: hypothetical protein RLZZ500_2531 [Bacteroidota bacterium]
MTEFPKDIKFKYTWRKYQQRVLDELQFHLTDQHLHVIAPPGSGKTVLGLEVAIRLNQSTLILVPTIAIRNQWIQRFKELFLQTNQLPDWISKDVRNPKFLTVVTYQALHAACNNWNVDETEEATDEEENDETIANENSSNSNLDDIVKGLIKQNIKTIVVDEAHHLKNSWWQTLTQIKDKLKPVVVGLTATPPYDGTAKEWQRYIDLNGSVDAEITVPELVIEGDLCPHQDYVFFTIPTHQENQSIIDFRQKVQKIYQEVKGDATLIQAMEQHPIWLNPLQHLEWIYNNLGYYSACLIFLKANNKEIPEIHLEVVGDKKFEVPELNYEWMETLLDFYLYKDKEYFKSYDTHQKLLESQLKRSGVLERRQINFKQNKRLTDFLTSSLSKLDGIKDIVDFEYKNLGSHLRLVILSDYIRKEYFSNDSVNDLELNKIGIIPIFERLRRENDANIKIGVLTGSLIIIPVTAFLNFKNQAALLGITDFKSTPVLYDANYISIIPSEHIKHELVHIITQIFQLGEIEVLIGTKSLLGEGWDAPAINTLILASFVGSFVLSNQMRGRAIRTQKGNAMKTGNIWHLVCIDPTSESGGDDFDVLKRRFKSFVGISFDEETTIENGIRRMNLSESLTNVDSIKKMNSETFTHASGRERLRLRWEKALQRGTSLIEEIKIPFDEEIEFNELKSLYLNKTIRNLLATLSSGLIAFGLESIQAFGRAAKNIKTVQDLFVFLGFLGFIGIVLFGRLTLKSLRLYLSYRDISKDIQHIGEALLNTLIEIGVIHSDLSTLKVKTSVDQEGCIYCHLEGGSTYEKSTFINALIEIIDPVNNPRYIIVRKNIFKYFLKQQDFHAVPELLGKNKDGAVYFQNQWKKHVGSCDLLFTRTIEGRKILLKARVKSLAAQFSTKVDQVNKWL